ncbi:hypothetical protein [Streptomyces sp. BK340]|uniref:hypothetical protein n=1 Tax=Streptomyces sp. BK340 TaxID=2572903 RepID=UPI00119CE4E1|nr:hypothetical protein [Streptomyces sp. BK340]TVZ97866.1 hypothetical protein FB157_102324 [Streptomyces sp. BK340]
MGTSSDGYQVKSGMSDQAGELDGAGTDTGKIATAIDPMACYAQDALGGSDSGPAFDAYAAAWEAEAKTLTDALHELADKIRASKGAYGGSDHLVSTQAAHVRAGDGTVGTVPAHAERPSALSSY